MIDSGILKYLSIDGNVAENLLKSVNKDVVKNLVICTEVTKNSKWHWVKTGVHEVYLKGTDFELKFLLPE